MSDIGVTDPGSASTDYGSGTDGSSSTDYSSGTDSGSSTDYSSGTDSSGSTDSSSGGTVDTSGSTGTGGSTDPGGSVDTGGVGSTGDNTSGGGGSSSGGGSGSDHDHEPPPPPPEGGSIDAPSILNYTQDEASSGEALLPSAEGIGGVGNNVIDALKWLTGIQTKEDVNMFMDFLGMVPGVGIGTEAVSSVAKLLKGADETGDIMKLLEGGSKAVLENANFAQKTYSTTKFSDEGIKYFSDIAGKNIQNVDDLVGALKNGNINPSQVPIDYVVRDGNTLILNTRSSQALTQAGIQRSEWNAVNRTGQELYEDLLTGQLKRNNLTSEGISTVRPSGGNK